MNFILSLQAAGLQTVVSHVFTLCNDLVDDHHKLKFYFTFFVMLLKISTNWSRYSLLSLLPF